MSNKPQTKPIFEAGEYEQIRTLLLDVHNNPEKYTDYEYKEEKDLLNDFKNLIKSCVKYGIQFRYTNPESKKQMIHLDIDGRIKILGQKGNCLKSDTIFHYSRLKYIILKGQNTLSIKAIQRIVADRKKIKEIHIDHYDINKLNNQITNLKPTPASINISAHYDNLKQLKLKGYEYKAQQYAKDKEVTHLLPFL